jgi:AcrR family transcriptional regulator
MARRSDHSRDEIKEMAIAAAEKIVTEQGYAGLSARKVAAEIGYTVGTLYLVFENLNDLVLQVNGITLDALYDEMQQTSEGCKDPTSCILALGRAYIQYAVNHKNRWGMIYEHLLPEGQQIPKWYSDKVARNLSLVEMALEKVPVRCPQKEIMVAARSLWGGVHGICILAMTNKLDITGIDSVQALANTLINHFMSGFMKQHT